VHDQQGRVVERGDRHHDADRLVDGEADLVQAGAAVRVQRQRVAVELGALECGQPDQVTRARRLAPGLGDRLPGLGADDLRGRLGALVGQLGRAEQDPHPLVGRGAPPGDRAGLGAVQRGADVVRAGDRDRPGDRPVERGRHVLGAAARGCPPRAADQHLHVRTSLSADRVDDTELCLDTA
jgi:hypothetical protein